MINTFDSDSDKFASKIGGLNKSLEELRKSIRQRKDEINDLMSSGVVSSKKEAKEQVGRFWSYLFRNAFTEYQIYYNVLHKKSTFIRSHKDTFCM